MNKCPRCSQSKDVTHVDKDGKYHLCIKCNYSWKTGETTVVEKTTDMAFRGVPTAQQFVAAFAKMENLDPLIQASMESQLTSMFMEQWIDGMKAGQLASIVHAKEYYQKKVSGPPKEEAPKAYMGVSGVETRIVYGEKSLAPEDYENGLAKLAEILDNVDKTRITGATVDYSAGLFTIQGKL